MKRVRVAERMDDPRIDPAELDGALRAIRGVNRWLGGVRTAWRALLPALRAAAPRTCYTLLDVGTGSADVPRALVARAARIGVRIRAIGVDAHGGTLRAARTFLGSSPAVALVGGDARRLPFGDGAVDFVTSAMLLHHLDDDDAVSALREIDRVARLGWIVQDLARSRWALVAIAAISRFFRSPAARHDGPASIRQALTPGEAAELVRRAGVDPGRVRIGRRFAGRFVIRSISASFADFRSGRSDLSQEHDRHLAEAFGE